MLLLRLTGLQDYTCLQYNDFEVYAICGWVIFEGSR